MAGKAFDPLDGCPRCGGLVTATMWPLAYGTARWWICSTCGSRRRWIRFLRRRGRFGTQDIEYMTEMYSGGDSLREISRVFGCAESTVGRTLRRYGVEIRPLGGIAGRPRDIPKSALMGRRIQFLYHDCKLNQREVAEVLGVAPGTVGWYMKHLDIPRRSRSENAMLRSRPPRNVVMERLRTLTAA